MKRTDAKQFERLIEMHRKRGGKVTNRNNPNDTLNDALDDVPLKQRKKHAFKVEKKELVKTCDEARFTLPFPPSVNHIYGISKHGKYLLDSVRNYRKHVAEEMWNRNICFGKDHISFQMLLWFPDSLKTRDIDNFCKVILDSLTKCGVWKDDSQIKHLEVWDCEKCVPHGKVDIRISIYVRDEAKIKSVFNLL